MWAKRLTRDLLTILATLLLGGLLGATLVRMAPGYGVDERQLDPRLSASSLEALRQSRTGSRNVAKFYGRYLLSVLHGNLGMSQSLSCPVSELLARRLPVTLRSAAIGLALGWALGVALALPAAMHRIWACELLSALLSGIFLCLPSAVLALLLIFVGGSTSLAIGLVVFPRVFRYVHNLLLQSSASAHVVTARAKGLGRLRILLWHILPGCAGQILAFAGVTVSFAFSAAIPIEVICDSPGVGQLAWLAALSRDLPVLVNLTVLVTVVTLIANCSADLLVATYAKPRP